MYLSKVVRKAGRIYSPIWSGISFTCTLLEACNLSCDCCPSFQVLLSCCMGWRLESFQSWNPGKQNPFLETLGGRKTQSRYPVFTVASAENCWSILSLLLIKRADYLFRDILPMSEIVLFTGSTASVCAFRPFYFSCYVLDNIAFDFLDCKILLIFNIWIV